MSRQKCESVCVSQGEINAQMLRQWTTPFPVHIVSFLYGRWNWSSAFPSPDNAQIWSLWQIAREQRYRSLSFLHALSSIESTGSVQPAPYRGRGDATMSKRQDIGRLIISNPPLPLPPTSESPSLHSSRYRTLINERERVCVHHEEIMSSPVL